MTVYTHPLTADIPTTQPFGVNAGGYNGSGGHNGEDKGARIGTPVRAPGDGVIEHADWVRSANNTWLYVPGWAGITVVLNCGNEEPSFEFNHLIKTDLNVGDRVKQGDIIGYTGNTKAITGATFPAHLHWGCLPPRWNIRNGFYGRVDPYKFVKGFWGGAPMTATAPNQRQNGPQMTRQRSEPRVAEGNVIREIPPNQLEVWEGYVHGQSVTVNGFTSDIWFKDKVGYAWCGGFVSQSTDGLPDMTPRAELPANQRRVGPGGANQRKDPNPGADVVRFVKGGEVEIFTGYVHGTPVTGTDGVANDLWYVDAKGYMWSGAFETQSTVGLPDLTVVVPPPPAPDAPVIFPSFPYLNGIDVAKYQESAALNLIASDFYFIKATEGGAEYSDGALASNVAEARLTGKPIGFYHYARPLVTPENTAAEEARSFLAVIKPHLRPGDLVFLDWEAENQDRTDWAEEWLSIVAAATGATPVIYLNAAAINGADWTKVEARFPLWYAGYGANTQTDGFAPPNKKPDVTWAAGVLLWQYTSRGRLPNYDGDLDLNIFYGTVEELKALGAKHALEDPKPNPPVCEVPPPVADTDDDNQLEEFGAWVGSWLVENFKNRKQDS